MEDVRRGGGEVEVGNYELQGEAAEAMLVCRLLVWD
jgi:hypothetical protein